MAAGAGRAAYNGKDGRSGSLGGMLISVARPECSCWRGPENGGFWGCTAAADNANTNQSCWGTLEDVERQDKRLVQPWRRIVQKTTQQTGRRGGYRNKLQTPHIK